jgi:hypothetical protein
MRSVHAKLLAFIENTPFAQNPSFRLVAAQNANFRTAECRRPPLLGSSFRTLMCTLLSDTFRLIFVAGELFAINIGQIKNGSGVYPHLSN